MATPLRQQIIDQMRLMMGGGMVDIELDPVLLLMKISELAFSCQSSVLQTYPPVALAKADQPGVKNSETARIRKPEIRIWP